MKNRRTPTKSNNRGTVLPLALFFVFLLTFIAAAFITLVVNESTQASHHADSTKAFYLAEAGVYRAIADIRAGGSGTIALTSLDGKGDYEVTVSGQTLVSRGYYPGYATSRQSGRIVAVSFDIPTPSNFFDNAITSANEIDLRGNYSISGDLLYGVTFRETGGGTITGSVPADPDPSVNPLPHLDFDELRTIAASQIKANGENNIYTAADIAGGKEWPSTFWFDQANNIPNIVYVETDLVLRGNVGTLGGFFVVVGDVITNPSAIENVEINGNGSIDGCVYTLGTFRINGGGGADFNIDGGIWSGVETRLNGGVVITYNEDYMNAIKNMDISYDLQITSWQEQPGT